MRSCVDSTQQSRQAVPVPDNAIQGSSDLCSAADLLASADEQIDYLVDGLLPRGGIMLLIGKPKSGKSVLARNLALAACRGTSFMDRSCEKVPVLWLCLEETKAQVSTAFRAMGLQGDDQIHFFFGHAAHDAQAWLERMVEKVGAGLVVIDTWHKLTLIESVNDYGAVNRANQRLQQLAREKGVAQVWIHHSNKGVARNGSEVLGSTALFAAVDTLMSMDRADDGTRTAWTMQRSGEDMEPTVVTMNDDQVVAMAGTRRDAEIRRAQDRILEAIGSEPLSAKDLKNAAGVRTAMFWPAINALVKSAEIVRIGEGRAAHPYRYTAVGNQKPIPEKMSSSHSSVNYKGTNGTSKFTGSHSSGTTPEPPGTTGTSGTTETSGTTNDVVVDLLAYAQERIS